MRQVRGWLAAVVGLAVALAVTTVEVRQDRAFSAADARPVPADATVSLSIGRMGGPEVTGDFRLESLQSYPELTPAGAEDEPFGQQSAAVVVAKLSCRCPVAEGLLDPRAYAVDEADRRWEARSFLFGDFVELDGLPLSGDIGSPARTRDGVFRFAEVIVVPTAVADEVRLQLDPDEGQAVTFDR